MQHFLDHEFKLERYFAKYEFSAKYLLCCSDCESLSMKEVLAMADAECEALWDNVSMGYTESSGLPLLRKEIATMYQGVTEDNVLVGAPQELILIGISAMLKQGDHCLVTWPGYQSLYQTCAAVGAEVDFLDVTKPKFDLVAEILALATPKTKAIVLNLPHNPTGYLPTNEEYAKVVAVCKTKGWILFSDEMYRLLELDEKDRLPSACEVYDKAITLCGLSKSLSMPGARMGWLVSQDLQLLASISKLKDYTTICPPAPCEVLSIIALRNRNKITHTNLEIIRTNLVHLETFFTKHDDIFEWQAPKAGSMCFPKLKDEIDVDTFCEDVVTSQSVMLLPGTVYDYNGNRFRLGFGRKNMVTALKGLSDYLECFKKM